MPTPLQVKAPDRTGGMLTFQLMAQPGSAAEFTLTPWPFKGEALVVEGEARTMPEAGKFANEAELRAWLAAPERVVFRARLTSSS